MRRHIFWAGRSPLPARVDGSLKIKCVSPASLPCYQLSSSSLKPSWGWWCLSSVCWYRLFSPLLNDPTHFRRFGHAPLFLLPSIYRWNSSFLLPLLTVQRGAHPRRHWKWRCFSPKSSFSAGIEWVVGQVMDKSWKNVLHLSNVCPIFVKHLSMSKFCPDLANVLW